MRIVAHLASSALTRLRAAVHRADALIVVGARSELARVLHTNPADVVVVDPCCDCCTRVDALMTQTAGEGGASALLAAAVADAVSGTPLVMYATLAAPAVRVYVHLSRLAPVELVLYGFDDSPELLHRTLTGVAATALGSRVVQRIAPALRKLPRGIRAAVCALYGGSADPDTVAELAAAAGTTSRSLERWSQRAGLARPKLIVSGALLVRAYPLIVGSTRSVAEAARLCGLGTARLLNAHTRAVLGITPSRVRATLPADEFVYALGSRLWPQTPLPHPR